MNKTPHDRLADRTPATGIRRLIPMAAVSLLGLAGAVGIGWFASNDALAQVGPPGGERPSSDRPPSERSGDSRSGGSSGSRSTGSGSSRFSGFNRSSRPPEGERPGGSDRTTSERSSTERSSSERSSSERSPSFDRPAGPAPVAPTLVSTAAPATPPRVESNTTAYTIPPAKPIPPEYEALLNRSMFIRGRQTTVQRPREVIEQPRATTVEVVQPVYRPEQHLLLTGVVEERDARTGEVVSLVAQVENTQSFTRERLTIDGVVGRGRIVDITVAGVVFENDGKVTTVPPGFFFDGRMAAAPGSPSVVPLPPPAPVATPPAVAATPTDGAAPATQPAVASADGAPAASPTTAPAAASTAVAAPAPALDPVVEAMRRRRLEQGGN